VRMQAPSLVGESLVGICHCHDSQSRLRAGNGAGSRINIG
jgi:hypothetical protein